MTTNKTTHQTWTWKPLRQNANDAKQYELQRDKTKKYNSFQETCSKFCKEKSVGLR